MYESNEVSNQKNKNNSEQMTLVDLKKERMRSQGGERDRSNTSYNSQTRVNNRYKY